MTEGIRTLEDHDAHQRRLSVEAALNHEKWEDAQQRIKNETREDFLRLLAERNPRSFTAAQHEERSGQ